MFSQSDGWLHALFAIVLAVCAGVVLAVVLVGCTADLRSAVGTPVPSTASAESAKITEDFTPPAMPETPTVAPQGTPIPIIERPGPVTPFALLPPCPENPWTPPPGPECRGRVVYTTTEDFISIPAVGATQTVTPTITPTATVTPGM